MTTEELDARYREGMRDAYFQCLTRVRGLIAPIAGQYATEPKDDIEKQCRQFAFEKLRMLELWLSGAHKNPAPPC